MSSDDITNLGIERAVTEVSWFDKNGPKFTPPAQSTIDSAKSFALTLARLARKSCLESFPIPEFSPTAQGSVDIHWGDGEPTELLVEIQANSDIAHFFGRKSDGTTVKGSANFAASNHFLMSWLLK